LYAKQCLSGVPKPFSDNQLYTLAQQLRFGGLIVSVSALQNGSDRGLKDAFNQYPIFINHVLLLLISIIIQYYQPIFSGLFVNFPFNERLKMMRHLDGNRI